MNNENDSPPPVPSVKGAREAIQLAVVFGGECDDMQAAKAKALIDRITAAIAPYLAPPVSADSTKEEGGLPVWIYEATTEIARQLNGQCSQAAIAKTIGRFAPPAAPTLREAGETTTMQERINLLRAAILQGSMQRIGTMYFCPSDGSTERIIDDGYGYALIAEQYGSNSSHMTSFPHCDQGTISVKGGMIRWSEARIAAPPPSESAKGMSEGDAVTFWQREHETVCQQRNALQVELDEARKLSEAPSYSQETMTAVVKERESLRAQLKDMTDQFFKVSAELETAKGEVQKLKAEKSAHRWNIEFTEGGLRVCRGAHDKSGGCDWEYYIPAQLRTAPDAVPFSAIVHGSAYSTSGDGKVTFPPDETAIAACAEEVQAAWDKYYQDPHHHRAPGKPEYSAILRRHLTPASPERKES